VSGVGKRPRELRDQQLWRLVVGFSERPQESRGPAVATSGRRVGGQPRELAVTMQMAGFGEQLLES
jgi:hypothetical protein